ncbi:MAG TPA: DUF1345 domain-containing protein [Geobacteraceae bacterium]|nr:DUF1345 domain-containing protein [Geobacteraceae bacterium]
MRNTFSHYVWRLRDRQRSLLCFPLGIVAGITCWKLLGWGAEFAVLAGWIFATGSYLAFLGLIIFMADAAMTQRRVSKDDPSPQHLLVVLSWVLLHTAFGQQYARIYYDESDEQGRPFPGGKRGGFSFPGTDSPDYLDSLYVAFTIGLTYATSDVNITSNNLRRLVLIHSVISFFFYSTVLGVVLNAIVTS